MCISDVYDIYDTQLDKRVFIDMYQFYPSYNITNHIQLLTAFQRSLADFLPLLSLPSDIKVGVIDYIIRIVGGALTFGLLAIALRRKFERKYTR